MTKNRSRTEITIMMLESARAGATKTRMMYKASLSHGQLIRYMKYLQQNDLLASEKGTQIYRPTEKGLRLLNGLNDLSKMVHNSKNYHILEP